MCMACPLISSQYHTDDWHFADTIGVLTLLHVLRPQFGSSVRKGLRPAPSISSPTPTPMTGTLKEMRAVVATAKTQEALAAKEVAALKAKLEGLEKRLAYNRSGVPGGRRVQ